jgi:hypothetical protein
VNPIKWKEFQSTVARIYGLDKGIQGRIFDEMIDDWMKKPKTPIIRI